MSSFFSRDLWAYRKTRFPAWLAILLPLVLVVAALREKALQFGQLAIAFTMALLLVLEFRLWDDLCDVELDRISHPERVLCRVTTLQPVWALCGLLMAINVGCAWLARGWWAAATLAGLHGLLAAWYGCRGRSHRPVSHYHVVLLKYPVFVWILGGIRPADAFDPRLFLSAALVYLGLCLYEVAHDGQLRRLRMAQICLAIESVLLAALGCWAFLSFGWFRSWP